jgi:hypothetical protein
MIRWIDKHNGILIKGYIQNRQVYEIYRVRDAMQLVYKNDIYVSHLSNITDIIDINILKEDARKHYTILRNNIINNIIND